MDQIWTAILDEVHAIYTEMRERHTALYGKPLWEFNPVNSQQEPQPRGNAVRPRKPRKCDVCNIRCVG